MLYQEKDFGISNFPPRGGFRNFSLGTAFGEFKIIHRWIIGILIKKQALKLIEDQFSDWLLHFSTDLISSSQLWGVLPSFRIIIQPTVRSRIHLILNTGFHEPMAFLLGVFVLNVLGQTTSSSRFTQTWLNMGHTNCIKAQKYSLFGCGF